MMVPCFNTNEIIFKKTLNSLDYIFRAKQGVFTKHAIKPKSLALSIDQIKCDAIESQ